MGCFGGSGDTGVSSWSAVPEHRLLRETVGVNRTDAREMQPGRAPGEAPTPTWVWVALGVAVFFLLNKR